MVSQCLVKDNADPHGLIHTKKYDKPRENKAWVHSDTAFPSGSWSSFRYYYSETLLLGKMSQKHVAEYGTKYRFTKQYHPSDSVLFPCALVSSFLSDYCLSAIADGHCSTPKPVNSGVPPGSTLSPTLLLLFINDHPLNKLSYEGLLQWLFSASLHRISHSRWDFHSKHYATPGWRVQNA